MLGLLGALDPYRKKTLHQELNEECLVIPDPDTTDTLGKQLIYQLQYSAVAAGTIVTYLEDRPSQLIHP